MIKLNVRLTPEAARLFSKLHLETKKQIKSAIKELTESPFSGHSLQEELSGFRSYKTSRYRVVYRVNEQEGFLEIFHMGHRRDVYEQFRKLLHQLT